MSVKEWIVPHRAVLSEGFTVGRALPFRGGQGVGPFIFLDHMGPHEFTIGAGVDIAPHPHIGLSTMTYLFEGEIEHKDSLGSKITVKAGDVNWMTAGKGIVHSERTPQSKRGQTHPLHGLQAWVALPANEEERDPSFQHVAASQLPKIERDGASHTLVAGEAFGLRSEVVSFSRLFYVHSEFSDRASLNFDPERQEAAIYIIEGSLVIDDVVYAGPGLLHFETGSLIQAKAQGPVRAMLLGGESFPERRKIWWNFVSSRPERIEEAKKLWQARALGDLSFGSVDGESDFIPLP